MKKNAQSDDAKINMLRKKAPDLADLVVNKGLKVNEAVAAMKVRERKRKEMNQPKPSELAILLKTHGVHFPRHKLEEMERKHEAWAKRRDAFNALSQAEQVEMARFVLAHDPELAEEVKQGYTPLFEAFHELKQAEAFLEELHRRGLDCTAPQVAEQIKK